MLYEKHLYLFTAYRVRGVSRTCIIILISLVQCVFGLGCASTKGLINPHVSPNFDKARFLRIGLLVVRVGNREALGVKEAIPTTETDYAIRTPKSAKMSLLGGMKENAVPVYIEEEDRLLESFPFYPRTTERSIKSLGGLAGYYKTEFYGNLTPALYETIERVLREKGYDVVSIKELSKNWLKRISESTIAEIIRNSQESADAVLVFQYMDVGKTESREGSYRLKRTGLADIKYNMAIFDCRTGERLITFVYDHFPAFMIAILHDPEVSKEKVSYEKKIRRNGTVEEESSTFETQLSDQENIDLMMKYIAKGHIYEHKTLGHIKWTGLNEVIP